MKSLLETVCRSPLHAATEANPKFECDLDLKLTAPMIDIFTPLTTMVSMNRMIDGIIQTKPVAVHIDEHTSPVVYTQVYAAMYQVFEETSGVR